MPAPDDLSAWEFSLPEELIARHPPSTRGTSRLLQVPLAGTGTVDRRFDELVDLLRPGDLLVANDTRVMASRLYATRTTGGRVELLLLEPGPGPIEALARPARKLRAGDRLELRGGGAATVERAAVEGVVLVRLHTDPEDVMEQQGEIPLPPYLGRAADPQDRLRYQTVFAGPLGSAAAPTAGLHFTRPQLAALAERGIGFETVTLHVGLGTFRPLRPVDLQRGTLHHERYVITERAAARVASVRRAGGRIVAVGTTSARCLEAATPRGAGAPTPGVGETDLFIRPGYVFRTIDGLLTNFHLPGSSLLMLVAALIGRDRVLQAYATAVDRRYRFYSYGDAMLLL